MDQTSNVERIVQCVLKQQENLAAQDNRMLSPVSEVTGSPDGMDRGASVCAARGNYRYCSPIDYHRTALHQSMETALVEQVGVVMGGKKGRGKSRVRSLSMSMSMCHDANCSYIEDCHTAPLMCFSDDTVRGRGAFVVKKSARRNPLRQIGNLLGCFTGGRRDYGEKKVLEKGRALALLELSQRQQNALAMKQDTIELLEWKLEQLQMKCSSSALLPPAVPPTASFTTHPGPPIAEFSDTPSAQPRSIAVLKPVVPHDSLGEGRGKCQQDRIINPLAAEQFLDLKMWKQDNAELSSVLHLFEAAAIKARLSVRYFCKVFMKQMEVSGYSVWRTLAEIEPNTKILNKEHTAFILESRLNKALYHSFENDSFDDTGLTRIIDPEKRCIVRLGDFQRLKLVDVANSVNNQHEDFDPDFAAFSENKMREMWFLFPWNVVFKDSEERSSFTAAFLDAAKCVWLLHRLAFSIHPPVTILRVGKGMDANSLYVEQVTPIDDGCKKCDGPKVEFMSMPGFQIRKKIIKCQVYRHLQCKK